eukprot:3942813-Prymnesium_polylepis.2
MRLAVRPIVPDTCQTYPATYAIDMAGPIATEATHAELIMAARVGCDGGVCTASDPKAKPNPTHNVAPAYTPHLPCAWCPARPLSG